MLSGKPAVNVLLYGDAGTGKSSSVKAIANEFAADGLRLVEVKKNQLYQIPALLDSLAQNPLKFILFIDDLSFSANDDNFAALKAILEGSVGGRAGNIAVYATSNRRHLIKETLTDREGDDTHESDTRQELMSLSARFGLTITFGSPDRERYLHIVEELAKQYGVELDELEQQAVKLLHAKTGACIARDIFGEPDEVYSAIFWHTTAKENMTTLEKILYVADYIEPNRDFEGVERLRSLAYQDLDKALLLGVETTIQEMEERKLPVHSRTFKARDWLRSHGVTIEEGTE